MPALDSYDYAFIRIVPRVDLGECLNAGVILFCRTRRFLGAKVRFDAARATQLAPDLDVESVERQLSHIVTLCQGGVEAGPLGTLSPAERFHWLVSPRSTVVQNSPVHSGLCADPAAALDQLAARLDITISHPHT